MPNEIKDKFSASAALTITLASLASSASGVGRQSTIVDNTTDRFRRLIVYVKIKQGTTPTGNKAVYVYLIRDDANGTPHRSDGAGSADAAFNAFNAQLIGAIANANSPSTGDVIYGEFVVENPGPKWGIAISHDTGVTLDGTGSNHWVRWVGVNPEVQ